MGNKPVPADFAAEYAALHMWATSQNHSKEDVYTLLRCTAWVFNRGQGAFTLDEAKAAALAIIQGCPMG